jgi:hypothetical protein
MAPQAANSALPWLLNSWLLLELQQFVMGSFQLRLGEQESQKEDHGERIGALPNTPFKLIMPPSKTAFDGAARSSDGSILRILKQNEWRMDCFLYLFGHIFTWEKHTRQRFFGILLVCRRPQNKDSPCPWSSNDAPQGAEATVFMGSKLLTNVLSRDLEY